MQQEARREARADYSANLLWSLTGAVFAAFGGEFKVPSWGDQAEGKAEQGTESAEEMRQRLLSRWGGD